jgi:hypothetical protein
MPDTSSIYLLLTPQAGAVRRRTLGVVQCLARELIVEHLELLRDELIALRAHMAVNDPAGYAVTRVSLDADIELVGGVLHLREQLGQMQQRLCKLRSRG